MAKFAIIDWFGNWLFDEVQFNCFDDAWAHVYKHAEDQLMSQNEMDDYFDNIYVVPVFDGRPISFADPWPDLDDMGVQIEPDEVWVGRLRESREVMRIFA